MLRIRSERTCMNFGKNVKITTNEKCTQNTRVLGMIQKVWKLLLQLLFPLHCPVCDGIVRPFGEKICLKCLRELKPLTAPWCMKCGKKMLTEGEFCRDCRQREHKYIRGRALYEYGSAAPSIYRLKYGNRQEYADFFGEEMARYLGGFIKECRPDAIVPIPLHRRRQRKRGYNQAQLLADALGHYTGVPVRGDLLRRVKNTAPLKRQNAYERQNNLKKAFIIAQNDVKLDTIIIVDDIYTTGSTVDEAAAVLLQHGVKRVFYVALACGAGV